MTVSPQSEVTHTPRAYRSDDDKHAIAHCHLQPLGAIADDRAPTTTTTTIFLATTSSADNDDDDDNVFI